MIKIIQGDITTLAVDAIVYGYPIEDAAKIAVREAREFLSPATAYAIRLRKCYGGQEATAVKESAEDAE